MPSHVFHCPRCRRIDFMEQGSTFLCRGTLYCVVMCCVLFCSVLVMTLLRFPSPSLILSHPLFPPLSSPPLSLPYASYRMYGALTGLSKQMVAQRHGSETLKKWRRGYATRPPPISSFSASYPGTEQCKCYAMLRCTMLYYAVLCFAILCYDMT